MQQVFGHVFVLCLVFFNKYIRDYNSRAHFQPLVSNETLIVIIPTTSDLRMPADGLLCKLLATWTIHSWLP